MRPLVFAALLASACIDISPTSVDGPTRRKEARSEFASDSSGNLHEEPFVERYAIAVSRAPSAERGRTYRIQVQTTAHFESGLTRMQLTIPELAVDSDVRALRGRTHLEWTVRLDSGATDVHEVSLPLPETGTYTLIAAATQAGATAANQRLQRIQSTVSTAVQFEIADDFVGELSVRDLPVTVGIGVTDCPVDRRGPDCTSRARRVGSKVNRGQSAAAFCAEGDTECCEQNPEECGGGPPPPSGPTWVTAQITTKRYGEQVIIPMRYVTVEYYGAGVPSGSVLTDANGMALIPCNAGHGGTTVVKTNLTHPTYLRITDMIPTMTTYLAMGSTCSLPVIMHEFWREATVWENILNTILGVQSSFNFTRSRIEVITFLNANETSYYSLSSDYIAIRNIHVAGEAGVFIASHEFGHAAQAKSQNGFQGGDCPSPHYHTVPSNVGCAFSEGFATFLGVYSNPVGNQYADEIEKDEFRNGMYGSCAPVSKCESVFAAMLLDLADPVNLSDSDGYPDNVQLPARHVFDAVTVCRQLYENRLGNLVIDSYSSPTESTPGFGNCLNVPAPYYSGPGPIGSDKYWVGRTINWPALTGTTYTNVAARINR